MSPGTGGDAANKFSAQFLVRGLRYTFISSLYNNRGWVFFGFPIKFFARIFN